MFAKLTTGILVLATLWSGYWFVGAAALETGLTLWLDERKDEGWLAEYSDISVRGFPNRFDTTLTGLELADPASGVAWTAPFFQLLALSYRPNHIIAVWPNSQTIASPYEKIEIASERMRGSIVFEPGTSLTLDRSTFILEDFSLNSDLGWQARVSEGRLATRQSVGRANTHDIGFEATDVRPSRSLLSALDPAGVLPAIIEKLKIDATTGFDAPWDRYAIERARPQITSLDLNLLEARWGDLELKAAGALSVDDAGIPEGEITVKATNWREMLAIARASGVLPEALAPTIERTLEILAGLSGPPNTIDAPLSFANGRISFGPIPLGPAPRLVIR